MFHKSDYVGRIVDVRFIKSRRSLAAVSFEFAKIAFIDRFHPTLNEPKVGEEWQCKVLNDSNARDHKRGALFIQPIKKLSEEVRWSVEDEQNTMVLSVYRPKVVCRCIYGKQVRSERIWSPSSIENADSSWPQWVRETVERRLKDYDAALAKHARLERRKTLQDLMRTAVLVRDSNGEFRFQWVGDWLTNGKVWIPRERPLPHEWRRHGIPSVPGELWDTFLKGLEGKFLGELLPFHREITAKPQRPPAMTERQRKVAAVVAGRMWAGSDECERVSIGRNLIFIINCAGDKKVYIVDNPGVGAIYIFLECEKARAFAKGDVTRKNAIANGEKRVCHSRGWEARLEKVIDENRA